MPFDTISNKRLHAALEGNDWQAVTPPPTTFLEKVGLWIHDHPTTVKVLKVASFLAGTAMLATLPLSLPALGTASAVGLGVGGLLFITVSLVVHNVLDLIVPPCHDMKYHAFTPGKCEGGSLYYQGDVPILSLDADNPYLAGKAHGYLLGDALNRVMKQVHFALHTIARQPRAQQLTDAIEQVKETIPEEYLTEMQGIVEGFKQWSKEHPFSLPKQITLDDLILLHLMPDSMHFNPGRLASRGKPFPYENVACSAVIDKDENGNLVFARNMDWPSFGLAGTYSLVINRKHKKPKHSTAEIGVPGFVGTLTGMNDRGLSLSMNVCMSGSTHEMRGMPAAFYNRQCLETCSSVKDVRSFVKGNDPLGPYHLTAADSHDAKAFHFYQSDSKRHVIRDWEEGTPFIVLNGTYATPCETGCHYDERQRELNAWFNKTAAEKRPKSKTIRHSLALPHVNNWLTTHSVIMNPESRTMEVSFNNAFAAKHPRRKVATEELFS